MAKYYLALGRLASSWSPKLRDCRSDHLELAEREAMQEFLRQRTKGFEDAMVRLVEAYGGLVVFAVNKNNIGNL